MMFDYFLSTRLPQIQALAEHPFVQRLSSGSLPSRAFTAWMVQGLYINDALIRFQAHLLREAPPAHRRILAVLLLMLSEDADWLEEHFSVLHYPLYPDTERYCQVFTDLERLPYPLALALNWCFHRTYQQLWQEAVPTNELMEFMCERWTSEEVRELLSKLDTLVRPIWSQVDSEDFLQLVRQLMRLEMGIWGQVLGVEPPAV